MKLGVRSQESESRTLNLAATEDRSEGQRELCIIVTDDTMLIAKRR